MLFINTCAFYIKFVLQLKQRSLQVKSCQELSGGYLLHPPIFISNEGNYSESDYFFFFLLLVFSALFNSVFFCGGFLPAVYS